MKRAALPLLLFALLACGRGAATNKAHSTLAVITAATDGASTAIARWSVDREADIAHKATSVAAGTLEVAKLEAAMAPVDGAVAAVWAAIGAAASLLAVAEVEPRAADWKAIGAALRASADAWAELRAAIAAVRK